MPQKRRVLVTGAAGFIGSHVVERLVRDGHSVVALDNLETGKTSHLRHVADEPNFGFSRLDVARDDLDAQFQGVEWVFHLAGRADIVPSIEHPLDYHRANVDGTVRVLEASRRAGVKRFIYAASSTCYGTPDTYPTPETAEIRCGYPYAHTKWVGEQHVLHWSQVYGLPAVSLRLFNVYGPRSRTTGAYGAVFGVFLAQKLAGKPFTVVGDGTQTRDFTYVTDVVAALCKAAESDVRGEVLNVGSGGTYSVNRLVELLGGPIHYIPKRPGEPHSTFADITKIRRLLGWSPTITFEKGVRMMMDRIEDWRDAPVWDPQSIADATRDWFRFLGTAKGHF